MSVRSGNFCRIIFGGAIVYIVLMAQARPEEENSKPGRVFLPSGQRLTPLAAPGAQLNYLELRPSSNAIAGGSMSMAVSPDERTLLVLTGGYNRLQNWLGKPIKADSQEYVFVYDISSYRPGKKQIIRVPNSFAGIAFSPNGKAFYVGGGKDDNIHIYSLQRTGLWAEAEKPIPLGHRMGDYGGGNGLDVSQTPVRTAGLAVTSD